jgi:inorganic pyrophosphatase
MTRYSTLRTGKKYTSTFKVYVTADSTVISPFHDIPLYSENQKAIVNVVNEIPRFENAKFEITKEEEFNFIRQDVKKEMPRFVRNVFPNKGYIWNYGALPQTWEDPSEIDKDAGAKGDNDPLDVIEIGRRRKDVGEVYQAKVIGSIALLDEDECDWKIIVIDVQDENAEKIDGIDDVEALYSGLIKQTFSWFEKYKIPDGKGRNAFALERRCMNKEFTMGVIERCHKSWRKLVGGKDTYGIAVKNTTLNNRSSPPRVSETHESDGEAPDCINEFEFVQN